MQGGHCHFGPLEGSWTQAYNYLAGSILQGAQGGERWADGRRKAEMEESQILLSRDKEEES